MTHPEIAAALAAHLGATVVGSHEPIQTLWSGYGELFRLRLEGERAPDSIIVKHVTAPVDRQHPRGWGGAVGHRRKLRSYANEHAFYTRYAARCDEGCRVPRWLGGHADAAGWLFLLEDLDAAGFPRHRRDRERGPLPERAIDACLRWLARFHATFVGVEPAGLWPVGTYWHLATRPDELAAMRCGPLRRAAAAIDDHLNTARFQTFVHGDAKLANFCFSTHDDAAAVDFQYVGGGVGMKDVVYFLGSVLDGEGLSRHESRWIDRYFHHLSHALPVRAPDVDATALEAEWRALHPMAHADFERFLDGWAPTHRKRNAYTKKVVERALASIPGRH